MTEQATDHQPLTTEQALGLVCERIIQAHEPKSG
jgi:hypothetical protein